MYLDIHTHLTHEKFARDRDEVIARAISHGLEKIVVNGLEPKSNREILDMAKQFPEVVPALGIYPIDAICHLVKDLPFPVGKFDVDSEIAFIRDCAKNGLVSAIGECGLDGYWVGEDTFAEQERVFEALIAIALDYSLPLIIHTRKLEVRSAEILRAHGVKKVNFHCYGGKVKNAIRWANEDGWWFSIPANARTNEAFTKMLKELPIEKVLTETDAPFLAPTKGDRNEPKNVVATVDYFAELRNLSAEDARNQIAKNFYSLFA